VQNQTVRQGEMKPKWNQIQGMRKGAEVWIVGSGPSLKGFDFSRLAGKFTIALNHTIEDFPQASALLFGDKVFLKHTPFNLASYKGLIFAGEYTQDTPAVKSIKDNSNVFIFTPCKGSPAPSWKHGLFHPCSAGVFALNLAIIMDAAKIYLLGLDYHYEDGDMHYYGDRYPHHRKYAEEKFNRKAMKFRFFEEWKDRIINCSPTSIITEFKKVALDEVLA
jgi:hypothetical protein